MFDTDVGIYGGIAIFLILVGFGILIFFLVNRFIAKIYSLTITSIILSLVFIFLDIKLFFYLFLLLTIIFIIIGLSKKIPLKKTNSKGDKGGSITSKAKPE